MEFGRDPTVYYDPGVPGLQDPQSKRWIEYGENEFCPIVPGDFVDGRYRIISLLGFGGDGMVWLAVDEPYPTIRIDPFQPPKSPKYVALKVGRGGDKTGNEELTLRLLMQSRDRNTRGGRKMIELFDAFDTKSPNGIHRCLVLELAAGSLDDIINRHHEEFTFDQKLVMFKQCVQAVAHVHSQGLVHGDIDLANFVLVIPNFSDLPETTVISKLEFDPRQTSNLHPVKMRDESPLPPGVPATHCLPGVFLIHKLPVPDLRVKLINFGEAFTGTKLGAKMRTPRDRRAPEIKDEEAGWESDIWALGLLFWELVFSQPFTVSLKEDVASSLEEFVTLGDEDREDILHDMVPRLWPEGAEYEDEEGLQADVADALFKMLHPYEFERPKAEDILGFDLFR